MEGEEKAKKEELALNSGHFTCERMHARISKATCFARQFALVQGSKRFLFPECGSCSQGKKIAQDQPNTSGGKNEGPIIREQINPGEKPGKKKVKNVKSVGEGPRYLSILAFVLSAMAWQTVLDFIANCLDFSLKVRIDF